MFAVLDTFWKVRDPLPERTEEEEMNHHSVTVETRIDDEGTPDECRRVDRVTFTCTAPPEADCRTYPECDCEYFSWNEDKTADMAGHKYVTGRECWMAGWFDAEGAVYVGDDYDDMRDDCIPAIDRSGPIRMVSFDEGPEWDFDPESGGSGNG